MEPWILFLTTKSWRRIADHQFITWISSAVGLFIWSIQGSSPRKGSKDIKWRFWSGLESSPDLNEFWGVYSYTFCSNSAKCCRTNSIASQRLLITIKASREEAQHLVGSRPQAVIDYDDDNIDFPPSIESNLFSFKKIIIIMFVCPITFEPLCGMKPEVISTWISVKCLEWKLKVYVSIIS